MSNPCPCMNHIPRADDPRHVTPCAFPDHVSSLGLADPDQLSHVAYKDCPHCGGAGYVTFTGYTRAGSFPDWEECRCVEDNLASFHNPHGFVGYHDRIYGHDVRDLAHALGMVP